MNFVPLIPDWLDAFFIAPFRWPGSAVAGMWSGSFFLALYAVVLGEAIGAALYFLHHHYYSDIQDGVVKYHNLSVKALHSGNKDAYMAANSVAHERFGKSFFAQASIGIATLLPLPFALAWMAVRFEGIPILTIPLVNLTAGYVFIFLTLYIVIRVLFCRNKKNLPVFRVVEAMKQKAREARGAAKPFFIPEGDEKRENKSPLE